MENADRGARSGRLDSLTVPGVPSRTSTLESTRSRSRSPFSSRGNRSSFHLRFDDFSDSSSWEGLSSSEEEIQPSTVSYAQVLPRSSIDDAISIQGTAFANLASDSQDLAENKWLYIGDDASQGSGSSESLNVAYDFTRRGSTVTFVRSPTHNAWVPATPIRRVRPPLAGQEPASTSTNDSLENENGAAQEVEEEDDGIGWIADSDMPLIKPSFKKKAVGALLAAVELLEDLDFGDEENEEEREEEKEKSVIGKVLPAALTAPAPSKRLLKCQKIGLQMGKKMLFPAAPKILRDLWVAVELTAAIVQFILACLSTEFAENLAFDISLIVLTIVSFILGLMDSWTYFYSMGSCRECYERVKKKREGGIERFNEAARDDEAEKEKESEKGGRWSKVKAWLDWSFELLRTVLSELLLYPLLMFDLFELLGGDFDVSTSDSKFGFSLFILGSIFLILSVYIVRFMILSTTILQLNRIPVSSVSDQDHITIIIRFLIHVFMQVCVHMLCIIAVGVKIKQENTNNEGDFYIVSPFLWYVMAAGWVIPIFGILSYFIVKYYWFREFSAGVFLDLISMLQTQGFAEAVFHSQASELAEESSKKLVSKVNTLGTMEKEDNQRINAQKEKDLQKKSKDFMKKIAFTTTKEEYENRQKDISSYYKFFYPLKIPLFALFGIFYDALLLSFCICLLLTVNDQGGYRVSAFDGGSISITLFVAIVFVLIANLNVLIAINLWVLAVFAGLLLIIFGIAGAIIFLPVIPVVAYFIHKKRKTVPPDEYPLSELSLRANSD